ncbi:MAG: fibronectin type III domain-containing protein [Polyangia bacterium]
MTTQRKTLAVMFVTRALVAGALGGALLAGCGSVPVAAPRDLAVSNGVLSWTDASGSASQYRIERQIPGSNFQALATAPTGATQYRDETAVQPGTTYTYRILAMPAGAPWSGTYSPQVSFTAGTAP